MRSLIPAILCALLTSAATGQHVTVEPRESVSRLGGETKVVCKVAYTIDSCRMTVGMQSYRLEPGNQVGDVVYAGEGLKLGECGALIRNIKEEWNGNVTCVLPPKVGNIEVMGNMRLIVARAPAPPTLHVSDERPALREGDAITAQCQARDGRPPARLSWYLDDEPLLSGPHQPVITPEPTGDLYTITQNATRVVLADDSGRRLVCRAEHEALREPLAVERQLIVHYAPKRLEESGPITIFGLKIGASGRLNVTVRASPPPRASWTVGERTMAQGQADTDMQALLPENLGNGYYNCTLILNQVMKEDVERTYYLKVSNSLGEEDFVIRISTMDEPAARRESASFLNIDVYGVELDAGAIVGIVIGVLILLIAVSLIVFAKATDRWCFAGDRRREHVKSSGESAPAAGDVLLESCPQTQQTGPDTESAVGGRVPRSRLAELGARVRAALPRHKDKVQATEQPTNADDDKNEEKKGVVYAELALGDQPPTGDKPSPPGTEYAEIVYTNPPEAAPPTKE